MDDPPADGIPILLAALFCHQFVGVLGAQTLVGWMEGTLFGQWISLWTVCCCRPSPGWLRELVGEYGI
jgi:ferrous iron transport protein B